MIEPHCLIGGTDSRASFQDAFAPHEKWFRQITRNVSLEPGLTHAGRALLRKPWYVLPQSRRQCDIVCLPTRYGEGIPRILIEAAATGLASIVSRHPGCREVVEDGVTGKVLSATSDIEMSRELSGAVTRYLESPDLLKEHKQAAYRHFLSREFNQEAIIDRFTELLGVHSLPLTNH